MTTGKCRGETGQKRQRKTQCTQTVLWPTSRHLLHRTSRDFTRQKKKKVIWLKWTSVTDRIYRSFPFSDRFESTKRFKSIKRSSVKGPFDQKRQEIFRPSFAHNKDKIFPSPRLNPYDYPYELFRVSSRHARDGPGWRRPVFGGVEVGVGSERRRNRGERRSWVFQLS